MAGIQCSVDIPKVSGLEDQQLTVGREFFLTCKGDWPKDLHQEALKFSGDENLKYQIKLLGFEFRSPEEADLKVTSHVAAQHRFPKLVLTDGVQNIELEGVQFQVHSVLPSQNAAEAQKVEPFGPFGPATIPVPLHYWLALVGGIALVAVLVGLRIWRFNQRREMLLRLKEHDAALSPLLEFHQSMRKLQRANSVFYGKEAEIEELRQGVHELSRMFKVYVSRRLKVPAFEWNERLIVKDIRQYHPAVYAEHSKKIHTLFSEFRKAENADVKISAHDVRQMADVLRKTLEGIEQLMSQEETARHQKGTGR